MRWPITSSEKWNVSRAFDEEAAAKTKTKSNNKKTLDGKSDILSKINTWKHNKFFIRI